MNHCDQLYQSGQPIDLMRFRGLNRNSVLPEGSSDDSSFIRRERVFFLAMSEHYCTTVLSCNLGKIFIRDLFQNFAILQLQDSHIVLLVQIDDYCLFPSVPTI
mmetsp:Transcript_26581/g.64807  ORF Transcript_26581/g.64807 Transcript_26581/m.64807 type:complete len:103 (-) Transcript_26581:1262-1570(-)